jgi:hypothetical protein
LIGKLQIPAPRRLLAAALPMALLLVACGGVEYSGGVGQASVSISRSALGAGVDRVELTISRGDGPDFPPVVAPLSDVSGSWSSYVSRVPAGPGRRFEVVLYDAGGQVLASGTARADVLAGGLTMLAVMIQQPGVGPAPGVSLPVFDQLTASAIEVDPAGVVRLRAAAHDPDPTRTVAYAWEASCGQFDAATSPNVTWIAPPAAGRCILTLSVNNGHGAATVVQLAVAVRPPVP